MQKAKGKRSAAGLRVVSYLLPFAFCILPFAFRLLRFAVRLAGRHGEEAA
jgi:hypothetical protein